MKPIAEFLADMRRLDVQLWADGDRLRYSAPRGTLTPALQAQFAERKAEILTFLHKADLASHWDGELPLSYAQQRMWFFDQLEPCSPAYNTPVFVHLTGLLNLHVLEQSLNEIIRRHEALRTTFPAVEGRPVQVIAPALTLTLPVVDLSGRPATEREAEFQRLATEEAQRSFDLAHGPLLRATLLRLSEEEHVLFLTTHHIVYDGWSTSILLRELAVLYDAFSTGKPSPLPELPIRYADFAVWQRQWLRGEVLEAHLAYWKQQLGKDLAMLELPTSRPRPPVQTFRGARQSVVLPKTLTEALTKLRQQEGVTLFMALLAAFKVLLHRYTGQDDIVLGSPIAGRNRVETEGLIGVFINTLALRTDLSGDPTFRELLGRVRKVALDAYTHQDVPFEKLVEALQPERDLSRTPLFQVMFHLRNIPTEAMEVQGLRMEICEFDSGIARVDFTLEVVEKGEGLSCVCIYNTDLFDRATIKYMLGHFQTLLASIVDDPEQRLSELSLLTDAERHRLLVEWNNTRTDYPKDSCIHALVEVQAERTPDAVAVIFEDEKLTYRELNHQANQLAHHLRTLGVGPEVLVGICVERSAEMVVGLLGILKAGGAYVPLDPAYPQQRLAYMLEDAQVSVLLTQAHLREGLPTHRAKLVCLDTDRESIAQTSRENPVSGVTPDNLSYVLYTSGSTGQPKGVAVEHKQLGNYTHAILERLGLPSGSSFAMVQPLTVDSCLTALFPPLCTGGILHVISPERASDSYTLAEYFKHYPIDCLKIAPSHLAALHAWSHPEHIMPRRRLIIGGEASRWNWVTHLQQLVPGCTTFNHYGPTEATVGVLTYRVEKGHDEHRYATSPLGRPLTNTQIYLLDSHGQPVPLGVPGEIHIGGANVARGYLNRPELTAEKFIRDPFCTAPGARLYKTGDLARYLPDGNIEFLGRVDDQVKIHGFRIELQEIEAVLAQHPQVRDAVVLTRGDTPDSMRLVAYVVPERHPVTTSRELRDFLSQHLPDYMIPAAFVWLEALPRTPHGKLDRQALPAPDQQCLELGTTFVTPRTPVEEVLATIWSHVLGLKQVGVHDNFFTLGGDSILSIQIIARANQVGIRLTPKHLFQYQTIAELATVVGTIQAMQAEQGLITGIVPLTPIQHRFFAQNLTDPHHWNMAMLLAVRQTLNPYLLAQAVEHLLVHHDALRLRFVRLESGWQQVNAGSEEHAIFSHIDLSGLSEVEQGAALEAVAAELQGSLNLSQGPLVRVALLNLGAHKPSYLLLVIHHLAVDGVSWRILMEDLQTAYQQLSRGEAIKLPPKTTSFKQWAERLTKFVNSGILQQELDYWLTVPWVQDYRLPVDYPGSPNTETSARTVSVSLSIEETSALLQEIPKAYYSQINDILLAALGQAFSQWTGAPSLMIDLEGHGREDLFGDVDLSRTVGWFTSRFPVLLDVQGAANPTEAVSAVQEQLRSIPNRGIGYGLLHYLFKEEASTTQLQELPQPEVSFNYLGQFDQVLPETSVFAWTGQASGPVRSPRGSRSHLLEISGRIIGRRLHMDWKYSENLHRRITVERLAQSFLTTLRSLISHGRSLEARAWQHAESLDKPLPTATCDAWITHPKRNPQARLRLFCFPYIGGGTAIFRTWPDHLPPEIEVCCVQLPGRENRLSEPPFTQLPLLVQTLAQVLRPYLNVPFAFFGHSMGALISFELARQLRRQGDVAPMHLLVSGCRDPQIRHLASSMHMLPESTFLEELRHLRGIPEVVLQNTDLMDLLLPTLRADRALCDTYAYVNEPPLNCPISAFGGLQDNGVSKDDLAGWCAQTCSSFTLQMFPGDHFFLHSAQPLLLREVSQQLVHREDEREAG